MLTAACFPAGRSGGESDWPVFAQKKYLCKNYARKKNTVKSGRFGITSWAGQNRPESRQDGGAGAGGLPAGANQRGDHNARAIAGHIGPLQTMQ